MTDQAEKDKLWKADEHFEKYPDDLPAEEIKKRDEEKLKKIQEETEESQTQAKRKGNKIFIYGHDFLKLDVNVFFIYTNRLYECVSPMLRRVSLRKYQAQA